MRLLDKPRFSKMMNKLSQFWTKDITDDLQEIWWSILKGYDIETIASACRIIISSRKKKEGYPNPADIIETIRINPSKMMTSNRLLSEPEPTEEDKLWGKYQCQLTKSLLKRSSTRRWKAAEKPKFRYEWFRSHTDMPEEMLNKIKTDNQ